MEVKKNVFSQPTKKSLRAIFPCTHSIKTLHILMYMLRFTFFFRFENFCTSLIFFNFALSQIHYHNLKERKQKSNWFENFQTKGKI